MSLNRSSLFIICVASFFTIIFAVHSFTSFQIVFCDVGQGAATLLEYGTYQAVVDTGPDQRVLSCIGRHIPFFDHTIETVIISHNQKDHEGGLLSIYNKYHIDHVFGSLPKPLFLKAQQFTEVQDTISLNVKNINIIIHKASQSSKDINERANVVTIKTVFLTSDINGNELKSLIPKETTVLEVPHHGSKYGLYPDSLSLALPTLAVISVGKKNTYGHPSKEALDILKAKKINVWRTDQQGELVINL
jgi:competence protein ComEC